MTNVHIEYLSFYGCYVATVETNAGERYQASYAHSVTREEVLEDFRNPQARKYFNVVK